MRHLSSPEIQSGDGILNLVSWSPMHLALFPIDNLGFSLKSVNDRRSCRRSRCSPRRPDLVGHLMVNAVTKQTSNDAYDAEGN
jgi:hypothetical protein